LTRPDRTSSRLRFASDAQSRSIGPSEETTVRAAKQLVRVPDQVQNGRTLVARARSQLDSGGGKSAHRLREPEWSHRDSNTGPLACEASGAVRRLQVVAGSGRLHQELCVQSPAGERWELSGAQMVARTVAVADPALVLLDAGQSPRSSSGLRTALLDLWQTSLQSDTGFVLQFSSRRPESARDVGPSPSLRA